MAFPSTSTARRPSPAGGRYWLAAALCVSIGLTLAASPGNGGGRSSIDAGDLREWLSYIASDELQGRAVFSAGLGLAAGYVADHLRSWGVTPAGDAGSYLQTVRVLGVKATSRSTVAVTAGGETRTFTDGEGISFPRNAGGKRHLTIDRVEFAGYGLDLPAAGHVDLRDRDFGGAAVVWLGVDGPKDVDSQKYRLLLNQRNRYAVEEGRAAASIGPEASPGGRGRGRGSQAAAQGGAGGRGNALPTPDFTTTERLDKVVPPTIRAKEEFFEFLFSHERVRYDELKRRAAAREPLPSFRL